MNGIFPKRPIMQSFTSYLNQVQKIHFATNPSRIKFYDQEIVIFRENTMARMLRHLIGIKQGPDMSGDDLSGDDLKRYVSSPLLCKIFWLI